MEPDPLPDTLVYRHSNDTQITNQDINQLLGISKKSKQESVLYLFAKKIIILTATITTFIYLSFHYFS